MEPHQATAAARPRFADAVASPTTLLSVLPASLLLTCFFLPHSGGSASRVQSPLSLAIDLALAQSNEPLVLSVAVLWPFAYALATGALFVTLVVRRPSWFDRGLLWLPVAGSLVLATGWIVLLFGGAQGSRMAMGIAVIVAPLGTCVATRVWWLCQTENFASAASWAHSLICLLAAFSLRWCWSPPVTELAWGGRLAIAAALMMMAASWIWGPRAKYDLVDRRQPPGRFQITLWQLVLSITLTAIALTFWRALESWSQ